MGVIKDFTTEKERKQIEADMIAQGWRLLETQYHFDGNHLIFENDGPEPEPRDLATEVDEIKAKIADYDELKAKVEELEKK